MSERQAAAAALLVRHGVDPVALAADPIPDATVGALQALLAGPAGAALATALAEFPAPPVAALLVGLEPHATRDTRKAIRRALYRFGQQKVPLPERPATPAALRLGPAPEALISPFGGDGDRLVWLTRELVQGGALVVYAHLHEPRGLLELSVGEVGRKRLRELRKRMVGEFGLRLVPVDWRVADALVVEAQARLTTPDTARDYLRVRPRLTNEPPATPAEPVSTRVTPSDAPSDGMETSALVAGSVALLEEPELRTWSPTAEVTRPFIDELAAVRESPLLVSKAAQEERVREVVRRAARTLVPPAVLARRLDGTAYVLAETGRAAAAQQALGVACALHTRPEEAADIPLVAALTERALGHLLAEETAQQEDSRRGSLLVTPQQFLRDRSSSHPGRTRG